MRGPLHGIPIALKDNIHTTDMPTTGGALAFDGLVPPYEATARRGTCATAGAIIIAKTRMTELANWVASGMPDNYNALDGYGMNPYDPRRDPRDATVDGRPGAGHRRLQLRHRHRRELLGGERRHRDLGLDPQPGEPEHAGRRSSRRSDASAATASSRSPPTRTPPARWRGPSPTPRSCWARSRAPRPIPTIRPPRAARRRRPRLHPLPEAGRPEGRAHRHPARVLLRQGRRRRAPRSRAAASTPSRPRSWPKRSRS